MVSKSQSLSANTLARRFSLVINALSPKKSPGPNLLNTVSPFLTVAIPDYMI